MTPSTSGRLSFVPAVFFFTKADNGKIPIGVWWTPYGVSLFPDGDLSISSGYSV